MADKKDGKVVKKATPARSLLCDENGTIRPICEGSASGLGTIKIRTSNMSVEGYCNFCDHGKNDDHGSKIIRIVHVIEGGRAKFTLCDSCLALVRNQWNREAMDPKERWME